jgi:glycine/D-amino acid oxidase-like deaminating enzyme
VVSRSGPLREPVRPRRGAGWRVPTQRGQILARRVLDLEFNADGAHSVVTDSGPMPVETLLVAAGAWSHRLASKLGHTVPLETQRGYHALLADPNMAPRRNVQWSERKFIATPMERACGSLARSKSRVWMQRQTIDAPTSWSSRGVRCFRDSPEASSVAGWGTGLAFPTPCR